MASKHTTENTTYLEAQSATEHSARQIYLKSRHRFILGSTARFFSLFLAIRSLLFIVFGVFLLLFFYFFGGRKTFLSRFCAYTAFGAPSAVARRDFWKRRPFNLRQTFASSLLTSSSSSSRDQKRTTIVWVSRRSIQRADVDAQRGPISAAFIGFLFFIFLFFLFFCFLFFARMLSHTHASFFFPPCPFYCPFTFYCFFSFFFGFCSLSGFNFLSRLPPQPSLGTLLHWRAPPPGAFYVRLVELSATMFHTSRLHQDAQHAPLSL